MATESISIKAKAVLVPSKLTAEITLVFSDGDEIIVRDEPLAFMCLAIESNPIGQGEFAIPVYVVFDGQGAVKLTSINGRELAKDISGCFTSHQLRRKI